MRCPPSCTAGILAFRSPDRATDFLPIIGASRRFVRAETDTTTRMERKKTGRPPKGLGPRCEVRARLPVQMAEALQEEAARRGMSFTDFVGEWASQVTGMPYSKQEALIA